MKYLQFRYSPIFFFITASIFGFIYTYSIARYGNKIPSLGIIVLGNFVFGIISYTLKRRNKTA